MSEPNSKPDIATNLKTIQTIWAALLSGVAMFLVITLIVRGGEDDLIVRKQLLDFSSMLVVAAAMMAAFCVLAYFTVPVLVVNTQRQAMATQGSQPGVAAGDSARNPWPGLLSIYQTQFILGLALLEGGAFLNLVVFMLQGSPVSLAVSGALLVLMAFQVPTRSRLTGWIEHQERLLRDETTTARTA